jgi:hypothetical protein
MNLAIGQPGNAVKVEILDRMPVFVKQQQTIITIARRNAANRSILLN